MPFLLGMLSLNTENSLLNELRIALGRRFTKYRCLKLFVSGRVKHSHHTPLSANIIM